MAGFGVFNGLFHSAEVYSFNLDFSLLSVTPIVVYANAASDKDKSIKENKNKCGVYWWKNLVNGKSYVGSSVNLSRRFRSYYNSNHLELSSAKTMLINKALIKYGHNCFTLGVLEYCERGDLLEREQHYIDILKPEYNILKTAGSMLGFKHREESKLKMSNSKKGFKHTEETKAKISKNMIHTEESKEKLRSYRHTEEALAKIRASSLGRKLSEESKAKIRANHPKSLKVQVLNIETGETMEFLSIYQTANYFGTNHTTIRNYIKSKKPYKNLYMISK